MRQKGYERITTHLSLHAGFEKAFQHLEANFVEKYRLKMRFRIKTHFFHENSMIVQEEIETLVKGGILHIRIPHDVYYHYSWSLEETNKRLMETGRQEMYGELAEIVKSYILPPT